MIINSIRCCDITTFEIDLWLLFLVAMYVADGIAQRTPRATFIVINIVKLPVDLKGPLSIEPRAVPVDVPLFEITGDTGSIES